MLEQEQKPVAIYTQLTEAGISTDVLDELLSLAQNVSAGSFIRRDFRKEDSPIEEALTRIHEAITPEPAEGVKGLMVQYIASIYALSDNKYFNTLILNGHNIFSENLTTEQAKPYALRGIQGLVDNNNHYDFITSLYHSAQFLDQTPETEQMLLKSMKSIIERNEEWQHDEVANQMKHIEHLLSPTDIKDAVFLSIQTRAGALELDHHNQKEYHGPIRYFAESYGPYLDQAQRQQIIAIVANNGTQDSDQAAEELGKEFDRVQTRPGIEEAPSTLVEQYMEPGTRNENTIDNIKASPIGTSDASNSTSKYDPTISIKCEFTQSVDFANAERFVQLSGTTSSNLSQAEIELEISKLEDKHGCQWDIVPAKDKNGFIKFGVLATSQEEALQMREAIAGQEWIRPISDISPINP